MSRQTKTLCPERRIWLGAALASGVPRTTVASCILASTEAERDLVSAWYTQFLRRPADAGGLNAFVQALQHGATDEQVLVAIVSSDEYFARV